MGMPLSTPAAFGAEYSNYCAYCGSVPAMPITFRGHRGFIIVMQFRSAPGPVCRDCGLATFRRLTGDSLWQGWWGLLSCIINPMVILWNLVGRARIQRLAPPVPGAPARPMDPGRPLYLRPQILGFLLPIAVIAAIGLSSDHSGLAQDASYSPPTIAPTYGMPYTTPSFTSPTTTAPATDSALGLTVGDCVWNKHHASNPDDDKNADVEVVPCDDPRAQATVLGTTFGGSDPSACHKQYPTADATYTENNGFGLERTYCLHSK